MKRNPFTYNAVGVVEIPFGMWDWPIRYSSTERAFIELASTIETKEEILQAKVMLEACGSIKAKRLFLWLARTADHPWYRHIDISRVNLGAGKRQIVPGGTLDSEFMITVPKEAMDGQQESLF